MTEKCSECNKEIDDYDDPHIHIEDYPIIEDGVVEFFDYYFCNWNCVKTWVSGK